MEQRNEFPAAINVRSPEAIRRIVTAVKRGDFRNYSEAAEVLIIEASERRKLEGEVQRNSEKKAAPDNPSLVA